MLTSGACEEGGAGRRRGQGRGLGTWRMTAGVEVGVGGGVLGGVEVGGRGGVESGVGGSVEGVRRVCGGRQATAAARAEELDLGEVAAWGRTNPVVKSEVAVARSRKRATATLATTHSGIRATATPFSFFPLFI